MSVAIYGNRNVSVRTNLATSSPGVGANKSITTGAQAILARIGETGKIGEDALKALGGKSQQGFDTSLGRRVVDQLVDGIAHEAKVGAQSLTRAVRTQIAKDVELIKSGQVEDVVWHFFKGGATGGGPSKPLLQELDRNNIKYMTWDVGDLPLMY